MKVVNIKLNQKTNLELRAYSENIIRVTSVLKGELNNDNSYIDCEKIADINFNESNNGADTSKIKVMVNNNTITFKNNHNEEFLTEKLFSVENSAIESHLKVTQNFLCKENEYLYGFGNVNNVVGLRGQEATMHHLNCEKCNPMFFSNKGYGILFNQTCNGKIFFNNDNSIYSYTSDCSNKIDYFVILGTPKEVIKGYRFITGKAKLLPKTSFGFIQSKNRYETQEELISTVEKFEQKQIPLDGVVIDYRWWGDKHPWNNMAWDYDEWHDPKGMINFLNKRNIQTSISVWPDFEPNSEVFDSLNNKGFLLPPKKENKRHAYDPSNPLARKSYTDLISKSVYDVGIYSIWLDANEPEPSYWEISGVQCSKGNTLPLALMYPLYDSQAVFESQEEKNPNVRVNTLSRGSVAGIQKYGVQSWSGDIPATFEQLRGELGGILNYHCSGLPFFSTDTGGYFGINTLDSSKRELFLRWLQLSCFNTIMRVHGRDCEKFPWSFGDEYEKAIVFYINLRELLNDYTYSETIKNCLDDTLLVKPLVYDYPQDENCFTVYDTFKFGDNLLVSPVIDQDVLEKNVYFPKGGWYDLFSGEFITNQTKGGYKTVQTPIEKIPVYAKEGSILVLDNSRIANHTVDKTINVYCGSDCEYTLLQDDGISYNYEKGEISKIKFSWNNNAKKLTISEKTGNFNSKPFSFNVVLIAKDGKSESTVYNYNNSQITVDSFTKVEKESFTIPTIERKEKKDLNLEKGTVVAHWKFTENEGGAVKDCSGFHNHGALMMCNWTNGYKEGEFALDFFGYAATVACGSDASLDLTNSLNIFVRAKIQNEGVIVCKGGFDNKPGYRLSCSKGMLELSLIGDSEFTLTAPYTNTGNWLEIEADFDLESKQALIKVDGKVLATGKCSNPIGKTTNSLSLGKNELDEHSPRFRGIIDEVIIKA